MRNQRIQRPSHLVGVLWASFQPLWLYAVASFLWECLLTNAISPSHFRMEFTKKFNSFHFKIYFYWPEFFKRFSSLCPRAQRYTEDSWTVYDPRTEERLKAEVIRNPDAMNLRSSGRLVEGQLVKSLLASMTEFMAYWIALFTIVPNSENRVFGYVDQSSHLSHGLCSNRFWRTFCILSCIGDDDKN